MICQYYNMKYGKIPQASILLLTGECLRSGDAIRSVQRKVELVL